jgi:hypothetical protein
MCLHSWGGHVAISPPRCLRAAGLTSRPVYSGLLAAYYKMVAIAVWYKPSTN